MIGLIIIILMIFQPILGGICHALYDKTRKSVPKRDLLHNYFGFTLTIFSVTNVYLGIIIGNWGSNFEIGFGAYLVCTTFLLFLWEHSRNKRRSKSITVVCAMKVS